MNTLLAAALEYAKRGWPVFPCWPHQKNPLTDNGFYDATTNVMQIRDWWAKWPEANIAMPMGPVSGIALLDFDRRKGGEEALAALEAAHGPLPETVQILTFDGHHRYFRLPLGVVTMRAKLKIGGGEIDIKADGGYGMLPPSIHPDGPTYVWELLHHVDEMEIAIMPDWLVELLVRPQVERETHAYQERSPEELLDLFGKLQEALPFIPADDYDVWLAVGMGIHSVDQGEDGVRLWKWWSSSCPAKYKLEVCEAKWRSFKRREDGISERTIFKWAREEGWPRAVIVAKGNGSAPHDDEEENARIIALEREPVMVDHSLVITPFSEITREDVHWLWYPYLPQGKLCLLGGDPSTGKTYITCALMTALSRGCWPYTLGDTPNYTQPGNSLYCFVEDGAGDTIQPRLEDMGADLSKIHHFEGKRDSKGNVRRVLMDNTAAVAAAVERVNAKLIIFDPLQRFLPSGTKMNDMESVSIAVTNLMQIALRTGATILLLGHLNKGKQDTLPNKFIGSVDWIAAARSALMVMKDPEDKETRYLYQVKSSLAPQAEGLKFHIRETELPRFMWGQLTTVSAEEMFASTGRKGTKIDEAVAWLELELGQGEIESTLLKARAKEAGVSHRMLWDAKEKLGIKAQKGRGINFAKWYWSLPQMGETTVPEDP